MSRTKHKSREKLTHRQRAVVRLTKIRHVWYFPDLQFAQEAGNNWNHTVSQIGGDARRRRQREQRQEKILGRRKVRRMQKQESVE